ncbi:cupin domain-containing protein [Variovorax sp. RA8]|uniref:cupin domain-containing protein n=1 Tax=Variovorax sp. (strain JCM 16519 / RA8) TaxID=662548 RepID=UPI000B10B5A2|nr:cupin domain-containing protein [Variovorax sp. RA8]VTU34125.1 Cupin domain protein [Variovorax sp. RA8]
MSGGLLPSGLRPISELDGSNISHFFGSGVCIKETLIPKGAQIVQHRHHYPHLAYLVSGAVELVSDSERRVLTGPACIEIPAGVHHGVRALSGVIWLCIHGTEADTPDAVDDITVAPINVAEVNGLVRTMNQSKED